ncbi:unnamed protein product [Parascedosporium putredinis]|uniref:Nitrate/nitrite transporter n=1 Tax=Parascedosporium putredinis TaxID=1442378 RepID=A0A9P1H3V4_9PEZI|nr:unnamed protein product [Parascedosporium putredinis]CAI7996172.1 unnamed protein product [Parascedosporium putredinis]
MLSTTLKYAVQAPTINPLNHKARSIPVLNPFDRYGRVFFFSWLGFMVAFLSWYAFPPLLTISIRNDLKMTQADVANSNIVALLATFLVRFIAGPLCDRFGPRYVFAGLLLVGSIPTALATTVTTPAGLIAIRFLWASSNVVGTANALAGGWGNAGGGITYFVMPALFDALVHSQGLTPRVAWRVAFVLPFVIVVTTAAGMLLFCDDTPTGKWSERHLALEAEQPMTPPSETATLHLSHDSENEKKDVEKTLHVIFSLQSLALAAPYACSFGGELAINSIIGSYYFKNFPDLGQTLSGRWAAMFGLLNVLFRPAGGIVGDIIYHYTDSVWCKKLWLSFLGIVMGVFELAIGLSDPHDKATMFGLIAGLAFFMDASNGASFAVVPHVHPYANGVLSGMVGATGNLGGVIFAVIFRHYGKEYHTALWIIGAVSVAINVAVAGDIMDEEF